MKVMLKGIVTREDAELALEYGADGIWVSNHGGRMENSLGSSVECVPEVASGVAGRAPIIVDGGFRRGADIFKELALGATAVGVGRPYRFGLAAFGQPRRRDGARHRGQRAAHGDATSRHPQPRADHEAPGFSR